MTLLRLSDVQYEIAGQKIIQNISFALTKGDFLTLTGPSGGGKSTLLKLIATLLTPTAGKIYFKDKQQSDYEIVKYRQQVSYCFQQPSLFGTTVFDNLCFPYTVRNQNFDDKRAAELLELVALPTSYLNKKITELSGGEKQRVALIRNLMFLPEILLLDEVITGLDEKSKNIVHDLIGAVQKENVTIIQVIHDPEEIQNASKILWLEKGSIIDEPISR
ncbi:ABC transporter ATP-binding protein [Enterococcus canintestini]|uniref:Spermidine/putrescine ABC transporter ATP-binding protein n=1 Tax=Enterococcus canintestini TaxID=317010 RepID=A0A267HRH9_9ENTE|nr:ATP-binding cassette domain-containing protein [Enterococcus canintestini]PAB00150.1 spermidine/putrescine ABC transporter ATP-binding protein [Enterococcus canintestini]